jgi:methylated-DNA-[protein]-cysteine S-methyltransferase
LEYRIISTISGYIGILTSERGLVTVTLPCPSERGAVWLLGKRVKNATLSGDLLPDLVERLKLYFQGVKVEFPDELDLSGATLFQRMIWQATRSIPHGETRSYAWVAARAGNPLGARAAGQALGKNPLPVVVPCHRVVAADGGLGGFTGGLYLKRKLLALESSNGAKV